MVTTESDLDLLQLFAVHRDEAAFTELTRRYMNMVYSVSLRCVRDHHLAEDVAQAVFIILARKAGDIDSQSKLPGWLHKVTCYCSSNALKMQARRKHYEQSAAEIRPTSVESQGAQGSELSPHLDDALLRLAEIDRTVIVARYLQDQSIEQVSSTLGLSIEAVKKRGQRALEKLRNILARRGVHFSVATLTSSMVASATQAAAHLVEGTTAAAMRQSASNTTTASLIAKGALTMIHWDKTKFFASVAASIALTAATGAVVIAKFSNDPPNAVAQAQPQPEPEMRWAGLMEITINDDGFNKDDCIDFDTGKLTTPGRGFKDRADGANWFRTTGCDAHAETEEGASGLYAMQMTVLPALNEQWDKPDAETIKAQLEDPRDRLPLMSADGELPQTYIFKTREGAMGICQLVAITRDAQQHGTIKLRYKLIEEKKN